jgi:hypothetical protein
LRIIVPNDDDPTNPDHLHFFDPMSLGRALDLAGLVVGRMEMRRVVKHEQFIYARASHA